MAALAATTTRPRVADLTRPRGVANDVQLRCQDLMGPRREVRLGIFPKKWESRGGQSGGQILREGPKHRKCDPGGSRELSMS